MESGPRVSSQSKPVPSCFDDKVKRQSRRRPDMQMYVPRAARGKFNPGHRGCGSDSTSSAQGDTEGSPSPSKQTALSEPSAEKVESLGSGGDWPSACNSGSRNSVDYGRHLRSLDSSGDSTSSWSIENASDSERRTPSPAGSRSSLVEAGGKSCEAGKKGGISGKMRSDFFDQPKHSAEKLSPDTFVGKSSASAAVTKHVDTETYWAAGDGCWKDGTNKTRLEPTVVARKGPEAVKVEPNRLAEDEDAFLERRKRRPKMDKRVRSIVEAPSLENRQQFESRKTRKETHPLDKTKALSGNLRYLKEASSTVRVPLDTPQSVVSSRKHHDVQEPSRPSRDLDVPARPFVSAAPAGAKSKPSCMPKAPPKHAPPLPNPTKRPCDMLKEMLQKSGLNIELPVGETSELASTNPNNQLLDSSAHFASSGNSSTAQVAESILQSAQDRLTTQNCDVDILDVSRDAEDMPPFTGEGDSILDVLPKSLDSFHEHLSDTEECAGGKVSKKEDGATGEGSLSRSCGSPGCESGTSGKSSEASGNGMDADDLEVQIINSRARFENLAANEQMMKLFYSKPNQPTANPPLKPPVVVAESTKGEDRNAAVKTASVEVVALQDSHKPEQTASASVKSGSGKSGGITWAAGWGGGSDKRAAAPKAVAAPDNSSGPAAPVAKPDGLPRAESSSGLAAPRDAVGGLLKSSSSAPGSRASSVVTISPHHRLSIGDPSASPLLRNTSVTPGALDESGADAMGMLGKEMAEMVLADLDGSWVTGATTTGFGSGLSSSSRKPSADSGVLFNSLSRQLLTGLEVADAIGGDVPAPVGTPQSRGSVGSSSTGVGDALVADSWEDFSEDHEQRLEEKLRHCASARASKPSTSVHPIDYYSMQTREFEDAPISEFSDYDHVLEIYNFPKESKTEDLYMTLRQIGCLRCAITWIDGGHALASFASRSAAQTVLSNTLGHPVLRTRPLSDASSQSQLYVQTQPEAVKPCVPRPQTNMSLVRRMVEGHLGVRTGATREQLHRERQQLQEAKEQKRLNQQLRSDIWEGKM